MKKLLAVFVMLAVAHTGVVALAQTQPQPFVENKISLNERLNACMGNKDCPTQVRLQIIQEENDEMNNRFQKIHQACADANFQNCIDKQKGDVDAWYSAQGNMQKLMQSMQTQGLKDKEPAAGEASSAATDSGKTSFWRKIWPFGEHD
jgi:hypothetical protein